MGRAAVWAVALVGFLGQASPAAADLVTFRFNGYLNYHWADDGWLLEGRFLEDMAQGSPFSMTLTWETDTPVQSFTAPDTTTYFPAFTGFSASVDGFRFGLSPGSPFGQLTVSNGSGATPDVLSGAILDGAFIGPEWGDAGLSVTKWQLFFPSTTWSSSAIPSSLPTAFDRGGAALYFTTGDDRQGKVGALLTEIHQVPEPSAMMFLALGLFASARLTRSRKRRS